MQENINEKIAYAIVENHYITVMREKEEYKALEEYEEMFALFPPDWFSSMNYVQKMKLLKKAIEDNVNLKTLPESYQFMERVVDTKLK